MCCEKPTFSLLLQPTAVTCMPPPENPPIDPFPPLRPTFSPVESRPTSYAAVVRRNTNINTNTDPSVSTNPDINISGTSSAGRDTEERYPGESSSGRERVHPWRESVHPWRERTMDDSGNENQADTSRRTGNAGGSADDNPNTNANISATSSSSTNQNTSTNTDSQTNINPAAPFTLREMLRNTQAPSAAPAASSPAWASASVSAQAPASRSTSRIGVNGLPYVRYYDFSHPTRDGNGRLNIRENDDRPTVSGCKSDQPRQSVFRIGHHKEEGKTRTDCHLFLNAVLSRIIDSSNSASASAGTQDQNHNQNQNQSQNQQNQTGAQTQTHDQSAYSSPPFNRPSAARRGPPIITDGNDRYTFGSTPIAHGQGQGQQRNYFGPIYPTPLPSNTNNTNDTINTNNRAGNSGGNGTGAGEGDDNDIVVSFLPSPPRLFDSDGDSLHSLTDEEDDDGNRVYGDGGDGRELWDEVEWMREVLDVEHANGTETGTGNGAGAGVGAGAGTRNERPFPFRRPGLGSVQADGATGQGADLHRGGFNRRRDYLDFLDHVINLPNNSSIPSVRSLTQNLLDSLNSNRLSQTLHTHSHPRVQNLINDDLSDRDRNTNGGPSAEGQAHGVSRPLEYALNISRSSSRAESRAAGLSPTNLGPAQVGVRPPVLVSSASASSSRRSRGRRARSAGSDLDVDEHGERAEGLPGENSPARKRSRTSASSSSSASSSLNTNTNSTLSTSSSGASSPTHAQSRQRSGPAKHFRPPYLSLSSLPVDTALPLDLGFPQPPSSAHLTLSLHIHRPSPTLMPAPLATNIETETGNKAKTGAGKKSEDVLPRRSVARRDPGYPVIRPCITFSHPRPTRTDSDATSLMTTLPVPRGVGIFYWEAEVLAKGEEGFISVGWIAGLPTPVIPPDQKDSTNTNASESGSGSTILNANTIPNTGGAGGHAGVPMRNMRRLVGWSKGSWGWHGDDGRLFAGQGMGERFSETWGGTSLFHLFFFAFLCHCRFGGLTADPDGNNRGRCCRTRAGSNDLDIILHQERSTCWFKDISHTSILRSSSSPFLLADALCVTTSPGDHEIDRHTFIPGGRSSFSGRECGGKPVRAIQI